MNTKIARIIQLLLDKHMTGAELCADLGLTRNQFYRVKDTMRNAGISLIYNPSTKLYSLQNNRALTAEEAMIMSRLDKLGLTRKQVDAVLKNLSNGIAPQTEPFEIQFSGNRIKFILLSDTHMGSKYYRADITRHAAINARRLNVDFLLNAGDTIEGMSDREGHVFEVDPIHGLGVTAQMDFMAEELTQFGDLKIYSIEAQGSHGGWSFKKANQGLCIGKTMQMTSLVTKDGAIRKNGGQYVFLGYNVADFKVAGITIRLRHPEQKGLKDYINSLMPNDKPHVLLQGHYHDRVGYTAHRNVHAVDAGCIQETTPFLQRKGSVPVLGYWVIEITIGDTPSRTGQTLLKNGKYIESFKAEFIPFYDHGEPIITLEDRQRGIASFEKFKEYHKVMGSNEFPDDVSEDEIQNFIT